MAIDKDIANDIREAIAAKIEAESGVGGTGIIPAVYAYPKATLEKYPAAVVIPSENLADYGSTVEDKLTFAFDVVIYYPIPKEAGYEKAELAVGEAVGEILRVFSPRSSLEDVCLWVEPVPSVWGVTDGDIPYRYAQVALKCVTYPVRD